MIPLSFEFIKEKIEKEKYILLSSAYTNSREKLKLQCNKGHFYEVSYRAFKQGERCPVCFGNKKLSYEFVKKEIEKYNYSLLSLEYKNKRQQLKIRCDVGHEYLSTYGNFQQGYRCRECNIDRNKHSYFFIKNKIEREGYILLSEKYNNANEKLKIKCDKGHEYEVPYNSFQRGNRCPLCFKASSASKSEKEVSEYIKSLNLEVIENDRILIPPLELDIVIPSKNMAIEYCGLYWHNDLYIDKYYHLNKLNICNDKGIKLITLFEDEWIQKNEIVKNRLNYMLGIVDEKVYARKCTIINITSKMAKEFIDTHHIQGYTNASINLGAFYNDELVSVMTFSKPSLSKGMKSGYTELLELSRFCSSKLVVGIASKFIKYFFGRYHQFKKLYSFADRRWSTGNVYEKIGMKMINYTKPNYFYFKSGNIKRYHRFNFRKDVLREKLERFDSDKTEYENMLENGWYRIWDCGNIKYEIENH